MKRKIDWNKYLVYSSIVVIVASVLIGYGSLRDKVVANSKNINSNKQALEKLNEALIELSNSIAEIRTNVRWLVEERKAYYKNSRLEVRPLPKRWKKK